MQSESKNVVFKIKLYDIKMIYATDMGSLLNPVQVLICMLYLSFFCGLNLAVFKKKIRFPMLLKNILILMEEKKISRFAPEKNNY
jgi:hypothetical protein